jgi:hypothetical protein
MGCDEGGELCIRIRQAEQSKAKQRNVKMSNITFCALNAVKCT